jgi:uncharacterized protein YkwD
MKFLLPCFLLLLFGLTSLTKNEEIDPQKFDYKLLERMVNERINTVRTNKNLQAFKLDSTLYLSAKKHSEYLLNLGDLSHTQTGNKSMQTPQKRGEHFGLTGFWIGENILYTYYNSKVIASKNKHFQTYTYEILADAILYSWVTSSGHYQNIINPDYTISGLALSVDFETKKVYVCQDFGKLKTLK